MRLKIGWYIVIFFAVSFVVGLLLRPIREAVPEGILGFLVFGLGFTLTYGIYHRIERGRTDFRGGALMVLGLVTFGLGASIAFVPFYVVLAGIEIGWTEAIKTLVGGYAFVIVLVIVLTTLLSWLSNKSPLEVIKEAFERLSL